MSLESIVNVTISSNSRGVSRKSFGIPLVIGYHTAWPELHRIYNLGTYAADLIADGIVAGSPIYNAVASLASNTPKVTQVAVGRLNTTFTHKGTITVNTAIEDAVMGFTVVAPNGGTETAVSYTVLTGDTTTDIATALSALVTAITDITAVGATADIGWTADNTGEQWLFKSLDTKTAFGFEDTTVDSSLVTDLAAITVEYSDYYGLILADGPSSARYQLLAGVIETQERILGAVTRDTDNLDSTSTTCLGYLLKAAQYFRTYLIYSGDQESNGEACWMGSRFAVDAGSSTWDYKALSGTIVDDITATQEAGAIALNVNRYVEIADLPVTMDGMMASGEWIDIIRGRDWLISRIRERVFGILANNPKIPYTDAGAGMIASAVEAQLIEGIGQGYLAASPAPFVTVPLVADVSDANKTNRILPDVYFEATLAGAIHAVQIAGVLKV